MQSNNIFGYTDTYRFTIILKDEIHNAVIKLKNLAMFALMFPLMLADFV